MKYYTKCIVCNNNLICTKSNNLVTEQRCYTINNRKNHRFVILYNYINKRQYLTIFLNNKRYYIRNKTLYIYKDFNNSFSSDIFIIPDKYTNYQFKSLEDFEKFLKILTVF